VRGMGWDDGWDGMGWDGHRRYLEYSMNSW